MRWIHLLVIVLGCAAGAVRAQAPGERVQIQLRDGTRLVGVLVEQDRDVLVLEHELLGTLRIERQDIRNLEVIGGEFRGARRRDPEINTVMLCPTPATIGPRRAYFRSFELLFLNFGIGVHDRFDVSFGALFPVTGEVNMLAVGGKFMLVDREQFPIGLAIGGNVAKLDETSFGSGIVVAGVGNARRSFNASLHQAFLENEDASTYVIVGGDNQIASSVKFVAEYATGLSPLFDEDDDIDGFVNIGFRWFGDDYSFTFTGIRPVGTDVGNLFAFPLAMFSRHF